MGPKEAYEKYKEFKVPSLLEILEKASQHSKTSLVIVILLVVLLLLALQYIPHYQVAQFNITNQKDLADVENSYRATLAQIFGGIAIAIGLYYTWRRIGIAEEDLKATKEGQITERFTRAVDQLGSKELEIRLGGIYALERIANESEKDYWPIIEILAAYVRKNSPRKNWNINVEDIDTQKKVTWKTNAVLSLDDEDGKLKVEDFAFPNKVSLDTTVKISLDTQAILTAIRRRFDTNFHKEPDVLDLQRTHLHKADLYGADLQKANFQSADLQEANLIRANLEEANLEGANLEGAWLEEANLSMANLERANLKDAVVFKADFWNADLSKANLMGANLNQADFKGAFLRGTIFIGANLIDANFRDTDLLEANLEKSHLEGANLEGTVLMRANFKDANLREANLKGAHLTEAKHLTVDQLSKVRTLYHAQLDTELEDELRAKEFDHLLDDEPEDEL